MENPQDKNPNNPCKLKEILINSEGFFGLPYLFTVNDRIQNNRSNENEKSNEKQCFR